MKGDGTGLVSVGEVEPTTKMINATRIQKPARNVREFYFGGLVGTLAVREFKQMCLQVTLTLNSQTVMFAVSVPRR